MTTALTSQTLWVRQAPKQEAQEAAELPFPGLAIQDGQSLLLPLGPGPTMESLGAHVTSPDQYRAHGEGPSGTPSRTLARALPGGHLHLMAGQL